MRSPGAPRLVQALALACLVILTVLSLVQAGGLSLTETPTPSEEAFDHRLEVNLSAVPCPADYDNQASDDACLAYGDRIPGPTWVFHRGDRVQVTLNHNVTGSAEEHDLDPDVAEELSEARYSLHRHGVSVSACEDGVSRPLGTQICGSTVGPEGAIEPAGNVTYNFTASFAGPWHYHDHAKGLDAGAAIQPVLGSEAVHRGLFGTFLVLEQGETTDHVFDLHLLDSGANAGMGLDETVREGDRFDILLAGLGDWAWEVRLTHDESGLVAEEEIGPGVSRALTVDDARPGTYTWTATSPRAIQAYEGEVSVQ